VPRFQAARSASGEEQRVNDESFQGCYRGRTVLVTGHTGFKGSWLSIWLHRLGARVAGLSRDVPTVPSHFEASGIARLVDDRRCDLLDLNGVRGIVADLQPDFVFHLAAQPLVMESYRDPVGTFGTNVMGSVHLLESLRALAKPCTVVMVTSDKCYDNVEWEWGYRETDRLGGKDPYSASKGAAEIAIRAYVCSFLKDSGNRLRVGVGRAGNVIGGGDWAADRIVADCVKAWSAGRPVTLRRPESTRPWQHVLEPLSGYLLLGSRLAADEALHGEPFNFGPDSSANHSVLELVQEFGAHWPGVRWISAPDTSSKPEAGLLKLSCDKALHRLRWRPTLSFRETAGMTADWYRDYYAGTTKDILAMSRRQIEEYHALALDRSAAWAT
jgi:CDP-glucose 4,6-dehydratase